jgi:hypothetical protein
MSEKRKYDSTVARIAGNLLSGVMANTGGVAQWSDVSDNAIEAAVVAARAIVAEVERTQPKD